MEINQDQMWLWKLEPVSPSGSIEADDDWLISTEKPIDSPNNATEPVMYEDHPTRAQVATKLLEELDEWIKEENFSDWLEEKIDLPIFEELPTSVCEPNRFALAYSGLVKQQPALQPIPQHQHVHHHVQQQHHHVHQLPQESTTTLLQEFESVLGDVNACHQVIQASTLTPPQSPPPEKSVNNVDTQLLVTLQPVAPSVAGPQFSCTVGNDVKSIYIAPTVEQWNADNISLDPLGNDVANELAVVDEFVRSCANDNAPSSPCTSTGGSCMSSEDSIDDPDWILDNVDKSSHRSSKNRFKPYSRPSVEDKKVRKKEQNKNAATRYRMKKKQEIKEIIGEERELADHNEKLQNQVKDLQREIGYLKGLMKDLFKAKGLIK